MSEQANPTLERIERLFKDTVWDSGVEAALQSLFNSAPWLRVWPIGSIIRGVVKLYSNKLFAFLKLELDVAAIKFTNAQNMKTFERETLKLKVIARGYGIDSPEFKEAEDAARRALSDFGRYRG